MVAGLKAKRFSEIRDRLIVFTFFTPRNSAQIKGRGMLRISINSGKDFCDLPGLTALVTESGRYPIVGVFAPNSADFGFETTLSGMTYAKKLQRWKQTGFRIEIVYLRLRSTQLALRRIAARVRQGGHNVPRVDVIRRFKRGLENFESVYRPLADSWAVYENSDRSPRLLDRGP